MSWILFACLLLFLTFTNAEWGSGSGWLPHQHAQMQGSIDLDDPTPAWNGVPIGIASIRPSQSQSQSQSRPSDIPITMDTRTRHDQQYGAAANDNDVMIPELQIYMEPTSTPTPYMSSTGAINQIVSSTATPLPQVTPTPTSASTPTPTSTLNITTPADDPYTESFRKYVTQLHDYWCQWMSCDITHTPTSEPTTSTPTATPTKTQIETETATPTNPTSQTIDPSANIDTIDTTLNINPATSYDTIYDDPTYDDVYDSHDDDAFFPSTTPIPTADEMEEDGNATAIVPYEAMDAPFNVDTTPIQSMSVTPTTKSTDDQIIPPNLEMTSFALNSPSQSDSFSSACSMIATQLSYTRWWLCFFSGIFCILLLVLLRLEWMQQQQHEKEDHDMEMGEKEIWIDKDTVSPHYRLLHTQVTRTSDVV